MHSTLHPGDDIDRLYVSGNGGKGLTNKEDSVDVLIQGLENYI